MQQHPIPQNVTLFNSFRLSGYSWQYATLPTSDWDIFSEMSRFCDPLIITFPIFPVSSTWAWILLIISGYLCISSIIIPWGLLANTPAGSSLTRFRVSIFVYSTIWELDFQIVQDIINHPFREPSTTLQLDNVPQTLYSYFRYYINYCKN